MSAVLSKFCRECLRNYAVYRRDEVIAGLHISTKRLVWLTLYTVSLR